MYMGATSNHTTSNLPQSLVPQSFHVDTTLLHLKYLVSSVSQQFAASFVFLCRCVQRHVCFYVDGCNFQSQDFKPSTVTCSGRVSMLTPLAAYKYLSSVRRHVCFYVDGCNFQSQDFKPSTVTCSGRVSMLTPLAEVLCNFVVFQLCSIWSVT